jgi:hypothetical protein
VFAKSIVKTAGVELRAERRAQWREAFFTCWRCCRRPCRGDLCSGDRPAPQLPVHPLLPRAGSNSDSYSSHDLLLVTSRLRGVCRDGFFLSWGKPVAMPKMTSNPKSTSEGIGLSPHAVTKNPSAPGSQIGHNPLNPVEKKKKMERLGLFL